MFYVLIIGEDIKGKKFQERDQLRNELVAKLKKEGISFLEYHWVWDETNRVQLVVGTYQNISEGKDWIEFLEKKGFKLRIVDKIP